MSSARGDRKFPRRQRFAEQFRPPGTSLSPEEAVSNSLQDTTPHPYHTPAASLPLPPPFFPRFENRSTSVTSYTSDVTMDDLSGAHESVFEYSDTSGEEREDVYFLPQESIGRIRNILGDRKASNAGESVFRELRPGRDNPSKVQYGSDGTVLTLVSQPEDQHDSLQTPVALDHHEDPWKYRSLKSWMTNLAYSFRSPLVTHHKVAAPYSGRHRSQSSWGTMQYPTTPLTPWRDSLNYQSSASVANRSDVRENTPLVQQETKMQIAYGIDHKASEIPRRGLNGGHGDRAKHDLKPRPITLKSKSTAATVAAFFLMDYEAGRPPTLSSNFDKITQWQLRIYRIHFSWAWGLFGIALPTVILFLAHSQSNLVTALMHSFAILFFVIEIWMREQLYAQEPSSDAYHSERRLNRPLVLFFIVLGLESWIWYIFPPDPQAKVPALVSSIFKPLVFFYISLKARHALEGLSMTTRIVVRVIMIEMMLILAFAVVACQLFREYESFKTLSASWLSLFELSTTVVNPSLWMPMYDASRANAIFFIFFIIVSVFYLHSLVLSVVFQTYIHAATEIHSRSVMDREEAIRRAFLALLREESSEYISATSVRKTLQVVRPHYNPMKIKALMDILDPSDQHAIDYPTFRTKIRQALNASIRTARSNTNFAMMIELIAAIVAVVNFVYIIVLTSSFSADWLDSIIISIGSAITVLGTFELVVRFNPTRIANFTPITRLNPTFDGLALVGALVSGYGILGRPFGVTHSMDCLLTGRAIDTIRIMRFFPMFRDVVRRSSDVVPALAGPLFCVLTTIHVFVSLGIALWGGAIDAEYLATLTNLSPLYYLNNFNSYAEGLVTIFNVLVVNDWHAIAQVFLHSSRCSSPYIVYPFFVATICCAVFIMVNVITAFFVQSFVHDEENSSRTGDFSIKTGGNATSKQIAAARGLTELSEPAEEEPFIAAEEVSIKSDTSTVFAFDVYEREGFDQIMRTVSGGATTQEQDMFARNVCDYLEVFESLTPGREKVGYMLCCQHSMNRFGNRRFQNSASDYLNPDVLHKVVGDMHSELLVLTTRRRFENRCLVREFPHRSDPSLRLVITGSLIRHQPAVSLLVSRVRSTNVNDP